jgi:hypothetical protein
VSVETIPVIDGFRADVHTTLVAFFVVAALASAAMAWTRTRSGPPVVAALLVGAVVVWSIANYRYLQGRVDQDSDRLQQEHEPVPVNVPVRGEG